MTERTCRNGFLLLAVALSAVVYLPITQNYFYHDDFLYLYQLNNNQFFQFLVRPHGGHVQPSRNLIFYLLHAAFGTESRGYFVAVLATHLANVALLFQLIWLFTRNVRIACYGAALWGTSPLNEGTLGWYSVFGQVMVATLLLGVLVQATRYAAQDRSPRWAKYVWYVAMLAASTSFGVGTAVALVFPLLIFLLVPAQPTRHSLTLFFSSLVLVVPALYVACYRLYSLTAGAATQTASSVLLYALPHWWYALYVTTQLLSFGLSHTVLGFWSTLDCTRPATYALTATYAAGIFALLTRSTQTTRRQVIACAVIALSSYGMIAIGRAALAESLGVTGADQLRYHYLASIPLVVALCLILNRVSTAGFLRRVPGGLALLTWVGLTLFSFGRLARPIDHHDEARQETADVLQTVRTAIAQAARGGTVYIDNHGFQAVGLFAQPEFPGWAGVFVGFFPHNTVDGKRVYFVDQNERTVATFRMRPQTRIASVLVSPSEVPRADATQQTVN